MTRGRFVLAAVLLALALPGAARAADATVAFKPVGGPVAWIVPDGVTSATFDVYGASGRPSFVADGLVSSAPGRGAHVRATLLVSPGEALEIVVGGRAARSDSSFLRNGGFNGGGAPGGLFDVLGGGGGGASDVRIGLCAIDLACALERRIIVAGGGGGGGGQGGSFRPQVFLTGGKGGDGGASGATGPGFGGAGGGAPGGGGSTASAGAGGTGGTATGAGGVPGAAGADGRFGLGGIGGTTPLLNGAALPAGGGGGGGGGYFGGGGGGSGGVVLMASGSQAGGGGGGGGGSSFVDGGPGISGGVVPGDTGPDGTGLVEITYAAEEVPIAIAGRNNLLGRGVTSVAVESTGDFDARTVDPKTACFGDAEAPAERDCTELDGKDSLLDMNGDRRADALLQFNTQEEGVDPGDTRACLTAETFDGKPITGCGTIVGIPTLLPLAGFPVFP